MEIYDENMQPIENPDLAKGWLESKKRTVEHAAIIGVKEIGHHEVIAEYPNGGKDITWVIDVPGVEAKEAWTEEVTYQVYHPYTQEELDKMAEPTAEEKEKTLLKAQIQALSERNDFLEDCMAEMASIVYA